MKTWVDMPKEDFYEIAKIIDNDFIGSEDKFSCQRFQGFNHLITNKVDNCSNIRVYSGMKGFEKITRIGPDTDGYEPITQPTLQKVHQFLTDNGYSSKLIEDEQPKPVAKPRKKPVRIRPVVAKR